MRCSRCGLVYDTELLIFGDICPKCGATQKIRKKRFKTKEQLFLEEKPRFFNIRISPIATRGDKGGSRK